MVPSVLEYAFVAMFILPMYLRCDTEVHSIRLDTAVVGCVYTQYARPVKKWWM